MNSTKSFKVVAAMLAVGTFGLVITGASAGSMIRTRPMHTCRVGSAPHLVRVKVHGKWDSVWRCHSSLEPQAKPKAKTS